MTMVDLVIHMMIIIIVPRQMKEGTADNRETEMTMAMVTAVVIDGLIGILQMVSSVIQMGIGDKKLKTMIIGMMK